MSCIDYELKGPLEYAIFRDCLSYIARRHEILRTSYPLVNGRPVQVVHPHNEIALPFVDATGVPNPEEAALRLRKQELARPIDLTKGPLINYLLIKIRVNEHWFCRTAHHSTTDPWSSDLYLRELALLYKARTKGERWPLPECEPLQYGDYSVWQQQTLNPATATYQSSIAWWAKHFDGAPQGLELPFRRDKPISAVESFEGNIRWGIDPQAATRLNALGQMNHATFFMVRLAIFVALLSVEAGNLDVVVGTYVKNRPRIQLQRIMGFFVNLVALRFRINLQQSFVNWLLEVREIIGKADANSFIPHDELRNELHHRGIELPYIQVIFSATRRDTAVQMGDMTVKRGRKSLVTTMPWGFSLNFDENDEVQNCRVSFDAHIYNPTGVLRFIERFKRLLDAVSRHSDKTLEELLTMSRTTR